MYEIAIKKTTIEERPFGKEWQILGQKIDATKSLELQNVRGYTPEITKKQEVEVLILKQNVEELDLPAVIKAINNL